MTAALILLASGVSRFDRPVGKTVDAGHASASGIAGTATFQYL